MDIYTTMEPHELAENVSDEMEAVYICAEILRRWGLEQPAYALILDEIPDFAIKQYLLEHETNGKSSTGEPDRDTEE